MNFVEELSTRKAAGRVNHHLLSIYLGLGFFAVRFLRYEHDQLSPLAVLFTPSQGDMGSESVCILLRPS